MLDHVRLKSLLAYDPDSGTFTWRESRSGIRKDGIAGCSNRCGYWQIVIDRKIYLAHRLAWLYVYGEWPERDIDHINRSRTDNRIHNLRIAEKTSNAHNSSMSIRNSSGVKGVYLHKPSGKWIGSIQANGKRTHVGMFESIELAAKAVDEARNKLHGEFACHG